MSDGSGFILTVGVGPGRFHMRSSPWAQAVVAMGWVVSPCGCGYDRTPCDKHRAAMLRAALPHLLRAVTEALDWERINALRVKLAEIPTDGRTNPEEYYAEYRTALLSALTDAAGRVG